MTRKEFEVVRNQAYREAEKTIEEVLRSRRTGLVISTTHWNVSKVPPLTELPESVGQLTELLSLILSFNQLTALPESFGNLTKLESLNLSNNQLKTLPESLGNLVQLKSLNLSSNRLDKLPESLGSLNQLKSLNLSSNQLTALPESLANLSNLQSLELTDNPLNPELAGVYEQGLDAIRTYLRDQAAAHTTLNEAKLILVGEGAVGKSCLVDALIGNTWQEHETTHGIQIKQIRASEAISGTEITLNAWDFGGQRIYRPTHQLFFSAPAVYLVVWKPREGLQQGFVKEWLHLVRRREPDAKILVVATHGGCQQRQPDINRQEIWDLFSKETVVDFIHVDSKPDDNGLRRGIELLKNAIASVAANLPEVGRRVPKSWQAAREALQQSKEAYLSLGDVIGLCRKFKMDDAGARLFIAVSHRLGYLIHYEHDPVLEDIVVLKPDWLATAISFVLDDELTRSAHGLVSLSRLSQLWNDPKKSNEFRYPSHLHPIFLRLMERFDLSYRVVGVFPKDDSDPQSLIAQLVPDVRPDIDLEQSWPADVAEGDIQQSQTCLIVDVNGQSATAEGLFYQLIVRLHKYSLGRSNYEDSLHWQRGIVLDDDYNGRALIEHIGNDIRINVRAAYPERFLAMLTAEVKYLVESFWEGLRCNVTVPCVEPCGKHAPGTGLFDVQKLIESKRKNRNDFPCPVCPEWQEIDLLLRNAPAARPANVRELFGNLEVLTELRETRHLLIAQQSETRGRFDNLDASQRELLSKADISFTGLMQSLSDEAKEGPRLFSLAAINRSNLDPKKWLRAEFQLTLWCEHSRLPLTSLNDKGDTRGVYQIELDREWFKRAAPFIKVVTDTLSVVLPVASSTIKLALDDQSYKAIETQLDLGKSVIEASIGGGTKSLAWLDKADSNSLEEGEAIRGHGAILRQLHSMLRVKDPGFGGLVRVMNKRQEFLWVHPQFEKEY